MVMDVINCRCFEESFVNNHLFNGIFYGTVVMSARVFQSAIHVKVPHFASDKLA